MVCQRRDKISSSCYFNYSILEGACQAFTLFFKNQVKAQDSGGRIDSSPLQNDEELTFWEFYYIIE